MLASALNFGIGFFGYPFDGQYELSITIETPGVRKRLLRSSPDFRSECRLGQQHPCTLFHVCRPRERSG